MAVEAPASGSIADATDRPQATLPAVGDADKQLVADHDLHDYPDPINHGFGIQGVLEDLDAGPHAESYYTRLFRGWREHVGDRELNACHEFNRSRERVHTLPPGHSRISSFF